MTFLWIAAALLPGLGWLVLSYRRKKHFLETPLPLQITHTQRYGAQCAVLTLQGLQRQALPAWTPGSHIVVNVQGPKGVYRRAYSLLGGDAHSYQIAVAQQPQGKVSSHLLEQLQPGDVVHAQPPRGRFFKLEASSHPAVCLIGGGVGIAPLIAMARQALHEGREVHLFHAARHACELVQHAELLELARQQPRLHYVALASRAQAPGNGFGVGRIHAALLARHGMQQFAGDVYLCGSAAFVAAQTEHLRQLGHSGRLWHESFTGNRTHLPHLVQVNGQSFTQGHAPTLLAACEENGVLPFAECRTGHCLNCRATLTQGQVQWLVPSQRVALPPDTILTCACLPTSDVVLQWNAGH